MEFDKIIIGAGLYGLYAALFCAERGQKVVVLEQEETAFSRATYINQARVHMGYHYPRSISTAIKTAGYFRRFTEDYGFCIHEKFQQIYATSAKFSWTDAKQFQKFCQDAGIMCEHVPAERYFNAGMCDGAFLTEEYTYDAMILRDFFLEQLSRFSQVQLVYGSMIREIVLDGSEFTVETAAGVYRAPFVLNATYAAVNHVLAKLKGVKAEPFGIKYELCEMILCDTNEKLARTGITVMDGPFFSIMPFGKTGCHSLTSVTFTPHETDYGTVPSFDCTKREKGLCRTGSLANCNDCPEKPESAWSYMEALTKKYLREEYGFSYKKSLFSMKPILKASEVDDSRPTIIRRAHSNPCFVSVLSGKINTVYDLDEILA